MVGDGQGEPGFFPSAFRESFSPVSIFAICHLLPSAWLPPKQTPEVWFVASSHVPLPLTGLFSQENPVPVLCSV